MNGQYFIQQKVLNHVWPIKYVHQRRVQTLGAAKWNHKTLLMQSNP